jgi:mannose-1-phosphate guanylyltransferase
VKGFLLAAGTGSRLRPTTDAVPKCLLAIDGDCLLDLWLDAFERAGVEEVLVNLHHLPAMVQEHVAARTGGPAVRTAFEPTLLGSAGTLLAHREWVKDEEMILVCNSDNLTDFDLQELVDAQRAGDALATLAVFHSESPRTCGVVTVDGGGRMVGFAEKPEHPDGDLANAGIYAFTPRALDRLNGAPPLDIGFDLLPGLVGRAQTVEITGYFRDIGTPASYDLAHREWPGRVRSIR